MTNILLALLILAVLGLGGLVAMWDIDDAIARANREERRRAADATYADARRLYESRRFAA